MSVTEINKSTDADAAGVARLAEVVAQLNGGAADLLTAKLAIIDAIRKIQDEKLWVYAKDSEGETYLDGKSLVNDLLGDALKDWSDETRRDFILMLVGEGWTAVEAAKVIGTTPRAATNAVKKADAAAAAAYAGEPAPAEGEPAEGEKKPEDGKKPEPTAAEKAAKVAAQAIASNKKVLDSAHEMSVADRAKLLIDYKAVVEFLAKYASDFDNAEAQPDAA
jgi:hypothetical protein